MKLRQIIEKCRALFAIERVLHAGDMRPCMAKILHHHHALPVIPVGEKATRDRKADIGCDFIEKPRFQPVKKGHRIAMFGKTGLDAKPFGHFAAAPAAL